MKSFYADILAYNYQCNQRLIKDLLNHEQAAPERGILLLNHIINSQKAWNSRILPRENFSGFWEQMNTSRLTDADHENYETSLHILNDFELNENIEYANSKGNIYRNSVSEIMYHIVNHGTYHRGQIALLFRNSGLEPLVTDYIAFKR